MNLLWPRFWGPRRWNTCIGFWFVWHEVNYFPVLGLLEDVLEPPKLAVGLATGGPLVVALCVETLPPRGLVVTQSVTLVFDIFKTNLTVEECE